MRNYIYFADKSLNDFDTFITNAGVYSAPARNYDSISIAGRSGNLIFDNDKFDNVEHRYPTAIIKDFNRNFAALKAFLLSKNGYCRLSDTFYPDEFYLATFKQFEDVKQAFLNGDKGTCVLVFERKPQRFLKSGEKSIAVTNNAQIKNPTQFEALPIIHVEGSGTLSINDIEISVDTSKPHLDIDCEMQEVLQTGGNLDLTLTDGVFPKLETGLNTITITGFTNVYIIPRWWTI